MPALKPTPVRSFGNDSWMWAVAIADKFEPVITEVNALSGFNMSCSLFREQEGITATPEKITLPALLCETEQYEANGNTTYSMADLQVTFAPQAASGADGKKAWEAMDDMAFGFLLRRQGILSATDWATGQFVDVIPAQLGVKVPTKTGTGADGVYSFVVPVSVVAQPAWNVPILAA